MRAAILGRSGLGVSRLIYGTLTLGPLQKAMKINQGSRLLEYAFDKGITTFDTAQYYKTYGYLKSVAKKGACIITKSYAYDERAAQSACEEAFREIDRDYIDVFLLHETESVQTIEGHMGAVEYYLKQKDLGHIGHVGISTHRVAGVLGALEFDELEIIHPLINFMGLGIEDGGRDDMEKALMEAHYLGKGIYGMKVLGGGNLLNKRTKALNYAMAAKFLDAFAIGMSSKEEIDYNLNYISGNFKEAEAINADISKKKLHIDSWCIGCERCVEKCGSGALRIEDGKAVVDNSKCVLCGYCAGVCPEFCIKVI